LNPGRLVQKGQLITFILSVCGPLGYTAHVGYEIAIPLESTVAGRATAARRRSMIGGPLNDIGPGWSIVHDYIVVTLVLSDDVAVQTGENGVDANIQLIQSIADRGWERGSCADKVGGIRAGRHKAGLQISGAQ